MKIMMAFALSALAALLTTTASAAWVFDSGAKTLTDGNWSFANVTLATVDGVEGLSLGGAVSGSADTMDFTSVPSDTGYPVVRISTSFSAVAVKYLIAPDLLSIAATFAGNTTIEEITVSPNLSYIGGGGDTRYFNGCTALRKFTPTVLPNVTGLGRYVFGNTPNLTGDFVFAGVISITQPYQFCDTSGRGSGITSLSLPNLESASVASYMCKNCTSLTNFYAPKCTSLGSEAFKGCSALRSVTVSPDLSTLPNGIFSGCSLLDELSSLEFTNVTAVGSYAFSGCSSLRGRLSLPKATSSSDYSFSNTGFGEIYLPSMNVFTKYAFQGSANLSNITVSAIRNSTGGMGNTSLKNVNTNGSYKLDLYWTGTEIPTSLSDSWIRPNPNCASLVNADARIWVKPAAWDAWQTQWGGNAGFNLAANLTETQKGSAYYPGAADTLGAIHISYGYAWFCDWVETDPTYEVTVECPANVEVAEFKADGATIPLLNGVYTVLQTATLEITYRTVGTYVFVGGVREYTVKNISAAATIAATVCDKEVVPAVNYDITVDTADFAAKHIIGVAFAAGFDYTSVTNGSIITWTVIGGLPFSLTYTCDDDHGFGGTSRTLVVAYDQGIDSNIQVDVGAITTPTEIVIVWSVDTADPTQAYLTDGNWKLKISTDKYGNYLKTYTDPDTSEEYTGYELASGCRIEGEGKLDLRNCKSNTGYGVVALLSGAFPMNNTFLTKFIGPDVVYLGPSAFRASLELTYCEVSTNIYNIGSRMFLGASKLATFVPARMPKLVNITEGSNPTTFATGSNLLKGDFYLGKVKSITSGCFSLNSIGTGITSIEAPLCEYVAVNAFRGCTSITNIVMPKLAMADGGAFAGCSATQTITLDGNALTNIGNLAFSSVKATGFPTYYPKLVKLGNDAFNGSGLAGDVSMPLITLSDRTFANCVNLKSLYAPALVSYGYQDFYGCTTLTNVSLDGSASFYALSPGNNRAPGNSFVNCPAFKELHWLGQNAPTNKGDHCFSVLTNIQPTDEPVIIRVKNGADRAGWEALCSTLRADLTDAHKLIPNYAKVKGNRLIGYIGGTPNTTTVEGQLVLDGQYYSDKGEYAWVVEDSTSVLMIYLK